MKYLHLFVFFFLGLLVYISPVEVFAQDPTGLVPCDGTTENPCNSCQLVVLGENILQWLIGVMLVIFAIMVAISGFNLVTSGGNPQAKTEAKKKLTNSFVAIVIVLAAWLIVDTLMRSLLLGGEGQINGRLWSTLKCINATETTMPNKNELSPTLQQVEDLKAMGCQFKNGREGWYCPNTSCRYRETEGWYNCAEGEVPPAPPEPIAAAGLENACGGGPCVPLATVGVPCKDPNSCALAPSTQEKVAAFHAAAGVSGARVTEAMPPTRTHSNPCHTNGTCIDYGKAGGMTNQEIKDVIQAAVNAGLSPKYEVGTQAEVDVLLEAGIPAQYIEKPLGSHITAPHFSIYDNG